MMLHRSSDDPPAMLHCSSTAAPGDQAVLHRSSGDHRPCFIAAPPRHRVTKQCSIAAAATTGDVSLQLHRDTGCAASGRQQLPLAGSMMTFATMERFLSVLQKMLWGRRACCDVGDELTALIKRI